jgi:cell division protein FtsI (penicillin-binding protein 3)
MGQEIAVSALQMLKAATAIANDGVLVSPRLVKTLVSGDGATKTPYTTPPPARILKPQTARSMRNYMRGVTSGLGTGWRAFISDIPLAVKTGTAQMIDKDTNAYSETDYIASTMALLPADKPSLVLYIAIVKPHGGKYYGGQIASPYIRETAEALVNYLGIPRGRNKQVVHSGVVPLASERTPVIGRTLPDLRGLAKRQIIPLLARDDLTFRLSGDGWVKRQSPAPGTRVRDGMVIELTFSD